MVDVLCLWVMFLVGVDDDGGVGNGIDDDGDDDDVDDSTVYSNKDVISI